MRQVDDHADEAVVSPRGALRARRILVAHRGAHAWSRRHTIAGNSRRFEKAVGGPLTSDETDPRYRSRTHVLLTWVHALAGHPAILDAVEDLIGPNILVYTSTWFIKEPESTAIAAWHQDATYFGLLPYVHVTAWLALTDATAENGCMEFLPGSHGGGQLPHRAGVVAGSVNRAGQAVVGGVDGSSRM